MHSLFLNNIGRSAPAVCRDAAEKPAVQGMAEEKAFSVLTFLLRFDTMKKTPCSEKRREKRFRYGGWVCVEIALTGVKKRREAPAAAVAAKRLRRGRKAGEASGASERNGSVPARMEKTFLMERCRADGARFGAGGKKGDGRPGRSCRAAAFPVASGIKRGYNKKTNRIKGGDRHGLSHRP